MFLWALGEYPNLENIQHKRMPFSLQMAIQIFLSIILSWEDFAKFLHCWDLCEAQPYTWHSYACKAVDDECIALGKPLHTYLDHPQAKFTQGQDKLKQ